MMEQELHGALATIHTRLSWLDDADERSHWVKNSISNLVVDSDWKRLFWVLEDVLNKLESIGGRPVVAHARQCADVVRPRTSGEAR